MFHMWLTQFYINNTNRHGVGAVTINYNHLKKGEVLEMERYLIQEYLFISILDYYIMQLLTQRLKVLWPDLSEYF